MPLFSNLIRGTTTNDNAPAGYVGECIESIVSAVAFPTTAQYKDVTSISLTAGDWDVTLLAFFQLSAGTCSQVIAGIGTATGNSSTGLVDGDTSLSMQGPVNAVNNVSISVASKRISLASTTTYYAKGFASHAGTGTINGRITARRVR